MNAQYAQDNAAPLPQGADAQKKAGVTCKEKKMPTQGKNKYAGESNSCKGQNSCKGHKFNGADAAACKKAHAKVDKS